MNSGPAKSTPRARLLDVTRLISRVGRRHTGVDRVELAYLKRLLVEIPPLFCVARTSLGYLLLNQNGSAQLLDRLEGRQEWGPVDLIGRFSSQQGGTSAVRQAQADCRRLAVARCRPNGLIRMLAAYLPKWTVYLNVGHSNLNSVMAEAVKRLPNVEFVVLLHDTIPLDYPLYQRSQTVKEFRNKIALISKYADLVITNSLYTDRSLARHCQKLDRIPASIIAHLGVDMVPPDAAALAKLSIPKGPYFVSVGTIEPRKNHRLLLDIWPTLRAELSAQDHPTLIIAGQRGWNNEDVFRDLDLAKDTHSDILEFGDLSDGAISALLAGSHGLLFPSVAEGYGIPPVEATLLNVPTICSDLEVYREMLGDIPIYLTQSDQYAWISEIKALLTLPPQSLRVPDEFVPPTWDAHFERVLELV